MVFNHAHVLFLLERKFPIRPPDDHLISREERKIANHIINILEQAVHHEFEIEVEKMVVNEEDDADYDVDEFQV